MVGSPLTLETRYLPINGEQRAERPVQTLEAAPSADGVGITSSRAVSHRLRHPRGSVASTKPTERTAHGGHWQPSGWEDRVSVPIPISVDLEPRAPRCTRESRQSRPPGASVSGGGATAGPTARVMHVAPTSVWNGDPPTSRALGTSPGSLRTHCTRSSPYRALHRPRARDSANTQSCVCAGRPTGVDRPRGDLLCLQHSTDEVIPCGTRQAMHFPRSLVAATPRRPAMGLAWTEGRSGPELRSVGGAGRRVVAGATALAWCQVGAPPHRSSRPGRTIR